MRPLLQSQPYYLHYIPGEIALYVEHDPDLSPEGIHAGLRAHSLVRRDRHLRAALQQPPRLVTFPDPQQSASLAFMPVETIGAEDHANWGRWVADLTAQLDGAAATSGGTTPRAGTLNWLASGVPDSNPDGVGGPAAWPIPYENASRASEDSTRHAWEFSLPLDLGADQRGAGVQVAVLDTAPDPADLERALAAWPDHPLLRTLLGPHGRLCTWYAGYTHLLQRVDYGLPGHPYVLSDHGLFSAGIIHAIAPEASIELVEVLNPYGAGTLETLAAGLAHVATREATGAPLVVNCSWVLNLPHPDRHAHATQDHPVYQFLDPDALKRMSHPLEWICDRLERQHVVLVAASGNDTAVAERSPAPPRYPAAYKSVVGVGALEHGDVPATYSNRADDPLRQGIATLGGGIRHAAAGWLTDPRTGILSAYTGVFPTGGRSTNGWARWSGTSFATPIVSGALAALLSEGGSKGKGHADPAAALDAIHATTAKQTPIGGAFVVRQG